MSTSSLMATYSAGNNEMFVTRTRYSSVAPAAAGPPPTTATSLVIVSCWVLPTTTTVGSGPVDGLPSPSVSTLGNSAVRTTAWLRMIVPVAVPSFTRRSNCTTACELGESVPSPATGNGGVRSAELTYTPAASGDDPPSGCPTGKLFSS